MSLDPQPEPHTLKGLDPRGRSPLCPGKISHIPQGGGGRGGGGGSSATPGHQPAPPAAAVSPVGRLWESQVLQAAEFGVGIRGSPGGDVPPRYKPVLGPDKLSYVLEHAGHGDSTFYVEGLAFPDRGFSGLVSFSASLLEVPHKVWGIGHPPLTNPPRWRSQSPFWLHQDSPGTPIFTDTVVFRVAPWIMTPNTQQPLEVFVCR